MSSPEKINILVVDDMPDKLLAMRAILEELGENVVTVQSGREALRQLLDQDFAVILLDVNMPDIDGFETAALIRRRKKTEHTPIIFVTSFSDETHAWQGYSLGAVDYILAPVLPEVLRTKVGVFVDLCRMSQQVRQQAEERVALAREQVARLAAEALTQRTEFLSNASNQLARSLDYEDTTSTLMQIVLPRLAKLAGLLLLEKHAELQPCEVGWLEGPKQQMAHATVRRDGLPARLLAAVEEVLQSGKTKMLTAVEFPELGPLAPSQEFLTLSYPVVVVVPLVARGKIIGALWLAEKQAAVNRLDVHLAESLANRAAVAIDNSRLYREIQERDRRKDEFLAMLGHELRNPLAAIANALECLRLSEGNESLLYESRAVLERQAHQMTRLVDDLLDVSRITRGKVELRKEMVDLAATVHRAIASTSAAIAARSHQLTVSIPPESLPLFADPTRLEQVLANLINNAAKYTEPGGEIMVSVEPDGDDLVIRVADTGIGIPDHLMPHVFELFTQGDRSLDRAQGGLGIGLTLVQRLVEMHGGSVGAKSRGPAEGTEFIVRLPRHPTNHRPARTVGDPEQKQIPATAQRILLVDDNADLALTMSALLRVVGHEVRTASDGLTAIQLANAWKPEAVLIDIGLPGIDGYEVAKRLRQLPSWENVLLVAVTGYGQQEDRIRSKQAGFDQHLVKPVEFAVLQQILANHATRELLTPEANHSHLALTPVA